jgi:hypothetical protein
MAVVGMAGGGGSGVGSDGGGAGGRGFTAGRRGGHTGGKQGPGAGQGYSAGFGFNYNDDGARFNRPRFNPNLGSCPLNYGPGWESGLRARSTRTVGGHGWNGSYRQGRNFQRHVPHQEQWGQ